ncbi:MAG: hypothetical protein JWL97_3987 [Gemmatimonadales bacterium]|nr:hypothetical protein [Gemmatimonadales bacterium]
MATDNPVPLATPSQMTEGPFANLVSGYTQSALNDLMINATRACESEVHRRLAPFTITESHRLEGMDPDEYTDAGNLPMDLQGSLGRSYAYALGASTLVRHVWLNEYAPLYQEYWAYGPSITMQVFRSYGGSEIIPVGQWTGPEIDSGHVWFRLGKFIPIGSLARITYSGGYSTIPGDLVQACKYMAASMAVRELDPQDASHDPDLLHTDSLFLLANWMRT